jgi:hypothetical protein
MEEINGLKILSGINTHPGSGTLNDHTSEIKMFSNILNNIDNKDNPIMIELGSFWALWSLFFRKQYPNGKNILVELGKRQLYVGVRNFLNNNFDCQYYHGGFNIESSGTFNHKLTDIEYNPMTNSGINIDNLISNDLELNANFDNLKLTGNNLDFNKIYKDNNLDIIDILHMDIQGSELLFIKDIIEYVNNKKILNIVIATHCYEIHKEIITILNTNNYEIIINEDYGTIGGDGYIYAKIKNN